MSGDKNAVSSVENIDNQKRLSPEQKRISKDKDDDNFDLNSFTQSQSETRRIIFPLSIVLHTNLLPVSQCEQWMWNPCWSPPGCLRI
jgi:hypothetical protein